MIRKIINIFLITAFVSLYNCGFKPMYKLSNDDDTGNYLVKITNNVSREIIEEINSNIFSDKDPKYIAELKVSEDLTPLIINTNGTVAKYRIEITINYSLSQVDSEKIISSGTTRGFAQYDVGTSEISNEDTRKSMTKTATKNALQILISKIQSSISSTNDN